MGTENNLYKLLLEQLPEGIILSQEDGHIIYVNPAAETIRNIKEEDLIGNSIIDCHQESNREKVRRAFEHLQQKPNMNFHRVVHDDANEKVYENTYASIQQDGVYCGLAVISRDVTKERELEEKRLLEQRQQEIARVTIEAQYQSILLASMETLCNLMEAKDVYTDGHSKRVAASSMTLYEHLFGLTEIYYDIEYAAKLHDLGKICAPESIVNKPGKLTGEEYRVIQEHPSIAYTLIKKIDPGNRISDIIKHHHERFDGTGYPDGLRGKDIPLGSRILSLADSYDAMRSNRPYRKEMDVSQCLDEIRGNAGTQFDPEFAKAFCELVQTGSID